MSFKITFLKKNNSKVLILLFLSLFSSINFYAQINKFNSKEDIRFANGIANDAQNKSKDVLPILNPFSSESRVIDYSTDYIITEYSGFGISRTDLNNSGLPSFCMRVSKDAPPVNAVYNTTLDPETHINFPYKWGLTEAQVLEKIQRTVAVMYDTNIAPDPLPNSLYDNFYKAIANVIWLWTDDINTTNYSWTGNDGNSYNTNSLINLVNNETLPIADVYWMIPQNSNNQPEVLLKACDTANNTTSTATITEGETKTLIGTPAGGDWIIVQGGGTINGNVYTPANITTDTTVKIKYRINANGACAQTAQTKTFTVTANIDPCDATASGNLDTDGDNISDICDLDDDNDGILDTDECSGTVSAFSGGTATQSSDYSNYYLADKARDNDISLNDSNNMTHTLSETNPWWMLDLGSYKNINNIVIYNRTDCCSDRLDDFVLEVLDNNNNVLYTHTNGNANSTNTINNINTTGRKVRVRLVGSSKILSLAEVIVNVNNCSDTDNDGKLDSLDTDSDNDGCPDATEAANGLATTATLAGGSNGGSSANLGTAVNSTTGIPNAAGSGQANTNQVVSASQITLADIADQTYVVGDDPIITSNATGTKTTTFNAGVPDYGVGSAAALTYKWYKNSAPNTTLSNSETLTLNNIEVSDAGDYTLVITTSENNCEEVSKSFTVTVACEYAQNTTTSATITEGETKTLSGTPAGGSWSIESGGGSINGNIYTPSNNLIKDTNVIIKYTIAANGSCSETTDNVNFTVRSFPNVSTSNTNVTCNGADDGSITFNFIDNDGGRTHIEFSLNGNVEANYLAQIVDTAGSITYSNLAPGTYDVWTRWGNNDHPTDLGSITITEPAVVAPIVTNVTICSDETYTWAANNTTYNGSAGTQSINISGANCADQTLNITVTPEPTPVVTDVTINSNETYLWGVNNVTYSGTAGSQTVFIEGMNCAADQTLNITVVCFTANNTTSNTTITEDQTKTLTGNPSGGIFSIVSGGGTIDINNIYTPADVNTDTIVTIRYTVAANGSCLETTDDVTFTVESVENPEIGLAKTTQSLLNNGDGTYTVTFLLTIENLGDVTLTDLSLKDDIVTQFSGLSPSTFIVTNGTLIGDSYWNGSGNRNILEVGQSLAPGAIGNVSITFNLTPGTITSVDNNATVTGTSPKGTDVSDVSTDGLNPDPNDNDTPEENDPTVITFSPTTLGSIGDTVWYDTDGDGIKDASENGLEGVTVTLDPGTPSDPSDDVTTTTDANGNYLFENLPAGDYVVSVDLSSVTGGLPTNVTIADLVQTFDADGLGTPSKSYLTLAQGENNLDQDFAYVIPSGGTTGGNSGGVESESLGDAISKIYVGRKKNSEPTEFVKSRKNIYNKAKLVLSQPYQGKGQTMLDMFPTELYAGNIANVTSPTDILDYTVADEVLSVDFSLNGETKGVVLGIKTSDKIYNHTKASCDRLRGAEILNIQKAQIQGYNFLMQGIKQRNGVIEYAISFAVAKNNNETEYTIQTNWYVNNYTKFNDVYNFQVWSTRPADTQKLVADILNNLKTFIPVKQVEVQLFPETYASKIFREKGELVVQLRSTEVGKTAEVSMVELYSETANNIKHRYNSLDTEIQQSLRLDIADGYEYDGLITVDTEVEDAFYHADGNWGLDYDKQYTEIKNYFIWNDFDREYQDDEYSINRNVEIKATSDYDYLTIYKSLLPGTLSADYSEYKYLSFTAKGSGLMELGLVKSSVENWKEQYRVMVDLSEEEQTYYIPFEIFSSTGTTDKLVADDLTTITFTFLPVEANTKELDLKISDVKFAKSAKEGSNIIGAIEKFENNFIVYPNPSQGNVNLMLFTKVDADATVTLTDITGKVIYKGKAQLTEGKNELDFNFKVKPGVMLLKVYSKQVDYGTTKVIFR